MAAFCLGTGVQPSEFMALDQVERNEFVRLAKKRK